MIMFRTTAEVTADRRVVLTLPPDTPVGKAELTVTVAPQTDSAASYGRARRHFGTVRGGDPRSADNDRIDADLARQFDQSPEG